ncbi:MAG: GAF domain-containing protein [Leptospiraceae bacterium]|nr:GAF domain-containing protein [Leptospiraceae bacterium]MDW7976012.1 adenylate/guanylate cyclase domain-containing protein [Leptospiraceae bacterium]
MNYIEIISIGSGLFLFILSIYYFVLSLIYEEKKPILLFATLNLFMSIRSFLRISWLKQVVSDPIIIEKLDHFTYFFGFFLFVAFFYELFKDKFPVIIRNITFFYSLIFVGLLFVPGYFFLDFRIFFHIFGLSVAFLLVGFYFLRIFSKDPHAKLRFFSLLLLLLGFGSDIFVVEILSWDPFITPLAMIIYSISYSIFLNYQLEKQKKQLLLYQEEIQNAKENLQKQFEIANEKEKKLKKMNMIYESLLDLSRKLSTTSNFDVILEEISLHLEINFGIKYFVIMTIDPEKQEARYFNSNLYKKLTPEQFETMKMGEGQMNLDLKVVGVHHGVYKHKKPLYLKHFMEKSKKSTYDIENFLLEKLNLKSLIIFPLIYNNEVFGFFDITHVNEPLNLTKEEYLNLNIFIQYFSQLFKNYLSVQEIQKQRELLENYNKEISKKNKIILEMNDKLSKMYNSYEINEIIDIMFDFLNKNFGIENFLLYRLNKNVLEYAYSNLETLYDEQTIEILKSNKISLDGNSIHSVVCKKKRFVYLPNLREAEDFIEFQNQKLLNLKSVLIFPLYFRHELLGTLDFSFRNEVKLNRVQISLIKIFIEHFASILKNKFLIDELEKKQLLLEKSLLELEDKKRELEKLNEFTKRINAAQDFNLIINDVFNFFQEKYNLDFSWYIVVDEKNKVFKSSAFSKTFDDFDDSIKEFLLKFQAPISEETGTLYRTYKKKKYFYIPKILKNFQGSYIDHQILEKLNLSWFLHVPLIVQNKVVGILAFTNYEEKVSLTQETLKTIQYFCDQIAGALYNTYLMEQIQIEKRNAELSQQELQQLNEFTKQIIEKENFEELIQNLFDYLRKRFELQFGWLLIIDKEKNRIRTLSYTKNVDVPFEGLYNFLDNFDYPYTPEIGTIYRSCERKKHLYLRRIGENFKGNPIDEELIKIAKIKWVLYIPLILKNETIGLLAFTNYEKVVSLSMRDIKSIEAFCSQIVGAIYNSYLRENLAKEKEKTEKLLLNILPPKVAQELKENGFVKPKLFKNATIVFTDFINFTKYAKNITPDELIKELDLHFHQFDEIISRHNLTKLKTIGDAYMFVGGIPEENYTHAVDACLAALEIKNLILQVNEIRKQLNTPSLGIRIGINTGEVIAGIVGKDRFAFDVWGDTVNLAQRLEASSLPFEINISFSTYNIVRFFFRCEYRGKKATKNVGKIDMYFLKGIHPKLSVNNEGKIPNERFLELYEKLKRGAKFVYKHEVNHILK